MRTLKSSAPQAIGLATLAVLCVGLSGPSATAQSYGTVKGKLVWGGADVPAPARITNVTKDPTVCAAGPLFERYLVVDSSTKGIQHGFAYIVAPKDKNPAAAKALVAKAPKVEIDQKGCEFLPYATALHQDQTLVFKSSDPVGHNVRYAGFSNPSKNVTLAANGNLEVKLKADRFPLPLNCDIHPWMKGYIMVFDHPCFAVTGEDGSFEITGVPAGEQKLVITLPEKVGFVTQRTGLPITVKAGEVTDVGAITLDPAKVKK